MNVIRHDNISNQKKTVAISNLAQDFCEHTLRPSRAKQRHPPIASARQKMQIVFAIISFEIFRHECKGTKPHPLRAAKDGPPRCSKLLRGEYNQWYHQRVISESEKHGERLRHPPRRIHVIFLATQLIGITCWWLWQFAPSALRMPIWGTSLVLLFPGNFLGSWIIERLLWRTSLSLLSMSILTTILQFVVNGTLWFGIANAFEKLAGRRAGGRTSAPI
jgi:hypothetical protein